MILEKAKRCECLPCLLWASRPAFPRPGEEGLSSPALGLTVCMKLSQPFDTICGLGLFLIAQDLMTLLKMERCGKIPLYSVSGETQLCLVLPVLVINTGRAALMADLIGHGALCRLGMQGGHFHASIRVSSWLIKELAAEA